MSVFCGRPSVWTLPSAVQSLQAERRISKATAAATPHPSTDGHTNDDTAHDPSAPQPSSAPVDHAPSAAPQSVLALSVSSSGRLLCALTAHCVWLYSVLADDCVCLGGWKRSPRLHDEEGDNAAVAFNRLAPAARSYKANDDDLDVDADSDGDSDGASTDGGNGAMGSIAGSELDDEDESDAADDDSHCVLSVLTSRHVLNVLRVAHRPDLATVAQQHFNASESGRLHSHASATPGPASSASSSSQPLQSSLSLSWPSSSPPTVAVSCQSSACLFGFPSASWHDAVSVSSAVHQPVSVHLLARVKLSNDSITCVSACRDGFLLGTAGGFVQRVALDGRPVSCMHATVHIEQQQRETSPATASSDSSPALRSLCISHPLHLLAFVLLDGRVGVCDERLLQPTTPGRHQQLAQHHRGQQHRAAGLLSACWLNQPAAVTSDAAVCVAINDKSKRLAVGWRCGCVQLYALTAVDGSLTAQLLRSVYPSPPPASIPAASPSTSSASSSSSGLSVECVAYCPSTSTLAILRRAGGVQLLDSNGLQSSAVSIKKPGGGAYTAVDTNVADAHATAAGSNGTGGVGASGGVGGSLSLCWSSDGFSLLVNSGSSGSSALPFFSRYSVLQVLLPQSAVDRSGRLCLLGADRLYLSKRSADSGLIHSQHRQQSRPGRGRVIQRSSPSATDQLRTTATAEHVPTPSLAPPLAEQDGDVDLDGLDDDAAELSAEPLLSASFDCLLSECELLCLPGGYSSHACPIRCVSVSDSGEHVAVSGSRGLCVWTRRTRKWRQLASIKEEWTVRPQHIAWMADHSIVVHSRARQHSRQHWLDAVPRDRQYQAHQTGSGAEDSTSLRWSLSSSLSLPRSSVLSTSSALSGFSPSASPWVSDIFVFARSHLSFSSVLCSVSFPIRCRLCDVVLSGAALIVRIEQPAAMLLQFELALVPHRSSRQPHRLSASTSAAGAVTTLSLLLPSPSAPLSSAPLPSSDGTAAGPAQAASTTSISNHSSTASPLSLPSSSTGNSAWSSAAFTAPSPLPPASVSQSLYFPPPSALLPPTWWSGSVQLPSSSAGVVVAVRCSLQRVELLPAAALLASGLHRGARQAVLMPHVLLSTAKDATSMPLPARHLLVLLSVTGDLLCIALSAPSTNGAITAGNGSATLNDNCESWLVASQVSAVWPQPLSTLSPVLAHKLSLHATPLFLTSGLQGLCLIHPQLPLPSQPASAKPGTTSLPALPVPLPHDAYPVAVNWRTGCVLTLRSCRSNEHDEAAASAVSSIVPSYGLSLHTAPFLHRLLSACCPSSPSSSTTSTATTAAAMAASAVLRGALCLLRDCVEGGSAVLLLELMLHSELVSEDSVLAGLPAGSPRSSHVTAVHSVLRTLADYVSLPCAYESVLAHVARKTDSSLWSRLFAIHSGAQSQHAIQQQPPHHLQAGPTYRTGNASSISAPHTLSTPAQLAADCIARAQFHTATLFLLIWSRLFAIHSGAQSQHAIQQQPPHHLQAGPTYRTGNASSISAPHTLSTPAQLAADCIARAQFHTATLFLLIVQRTDSPRAAHRLAVTIMRQLDTRRQRAAAMMERAGGTASAVSLDELEAELLLDRQLRRFAQQTAAIVAEQQQQQQQRAREEKPDSAAAAVAKTQNGYHPTVALTATVDHTPLEQPNLPEMQIADLTAAAHNTATEDLTVGKSHAAQPSNDDEPVKEDGSNCAVQ